MGAMAADAGGDGAMIGQDCGSDKRKPARVLLRTDHCVIDSSSANYCVGVSCAELVR